MSTNDKISTDTTKPVGDEKTDDCKCGGKCGKAAKDCTCGTKKLPAKPSTVQTSSDTSKK